MCKRLIYLFVDNARYWRIKEKLRWIRQAQSVQAARWRLTNFLRHANEQLDCNRQGTKNGSCSAGGRHTATPAWKG
jgi:hypothetical protein